jgi:hypothetical protein
MAGHARACRVCGSDDPETLAGLNEGLPPDELDEWIQQNHDLGLAGLAGVAGVSVSGVAGDCGGGVLPWGGLPAGAAVTAGGRGTDGALSMADGTPSTISAGEFQRVRRGAERAVDANGGVFGRWATARRLASNQQLKKRKQS